MPLIAPPGIRWKTIQTVEWNWYWRLNNTNIYTVDMTLPVAVDPDRCIIMARGNGGYNHNDNGALYGNIQMIDSDTVRASYIAKRSQSDTGSYGPYGPVPVTVLEYNRPFRSSQIVTGSGSNVSLAQPVNWNRALLVRNFFAWSASYTLGFYLKIVDSSHIAQGSYPNFAGYSLAQSFFRSHIVEF